MRCNIVQWFIAWTFKLDLPGHSFSQVPVGWHWTLSFLVFYFFLLKLIRNLPGIIAECIKAEHQCAYHSKWRWKSLSHVWLFATPWTRQFMEFSRPEYWSGYPFPSSGDLPNPGIKHRSPTLQTDSLPAEPPGKPTICKLTIIYVTYRHSETVSIATHHSSNHLFVQQIFLLTKYYVTDTGLHAGNTFGNKAEWRMGPTSWTLQLGEVDH